MHKEDNNRKYVVYDVTDMSQNEIDATTLNNVLAHLTLFLSANCVIVTTEEEYGKIMPLSDKYHAKIAGYFYFQYFFQDFDLCLRTCSQESPKQYQINNMLT